MIHEFYVEFSCLEITDYFIALSGYFFASAINENE